MIIVHRAVTNDKGEVEYYGIEDSDDGSFYVQRARILKATENDLGPKERIIVKLCKRILEGK